MKIPIRNVWLLQLFASSLYASGGQSLVEAEENPDNLPELVAHILAGEVTQRLHTGLTVGFQESRRNLTRVRGRINVLPTERGALLRRGLVSCTFDEIVTDIPSNRLVRAALERAATLVPHEPKFRSLALQLHAAGVRGAPPRLSHVPTMLRQRLLARDRLMLTAAELLMTLSIPTTDDGSKMLPLPSLDDRFMRKLFEHAAVGLYRHKLEPHGWHVSHSKRQKWPTESTSEGILQILPGMELDIVLEAPLTTGQPPRRLVIDTKYTSITKPGHYRESTLSSDYVYQIYAYVKSQDQTENPHKAEGLMLHPSIGERVDEEAVIQGHRIRFATVDLTAPATEFVDGFLSAISPEIKKRTFS